MFERLKEIRTQKGVTCAVMADVLGLKTRGAYHKKENGDVPFSLEDARRISLYFDIPIEDIFLEKAYQMKSRNSTVQASLNNNLKKG